MKAIRYTLCMVTAIVLPILIYATPNSQQDIYHSDDSRDSALIKLYLKKGMRTESVNFDSAMHYYNTALDISERNSWIDEQAKVLVNIGFAYRYSLNSRESLDYLDKGLKLYKEAANDKGVADTYYNMGIFYCYFEDFAKSITCFINAVELSTKLGDNKRLGMIYNNLGLQYYYTGQYEKSNIYQYKALGYKEAIGDRTINFTHLNIGLNYYQQKKYEKSIEQYKKALNLTNIDKERSVVATCNKNIADVYVDMGRYDSAMFYLERAHIIYKQLDDKISIARYYNKLGDIYLHEDNLDKAEKSYLNAVSLLSYNNAKRPLFYSFSNLAELNILKIDKGIGNRQLLAKKAMQFGTKMRALADSTGMLHWKKDSYEIMYNLYKRRGDSDKALKYASDLLLIKDSLSSVNRDKVVSDLQVKYETLQKEQHIEQQRKDIDIQKRVIDNERRSKNILIIGLSVLILLMVTIYILYVQKQRANRKLQLLSQFKDDMSGMVVHDLKTPLSTILNADVIADGKERSNLIKQSALSINNLVDNVLDVYKYKSTDIKIVESDAEITDIVNNSISQVALLASKRSITINIDIKEGYIVSVDTVILDRVLINLMSNAIKFSPVGSTVTVCAKQDSNKSLLLSVADNGEGIPDSMKESVFDRFVQGTNSSNRNRGSVGLGLTFCKMAVEAHNGTISVESGEKQGATFIIVLNNVIKDKSNNAVYNTGIQAYDLSNSDIEYLKPFCDKLKSYKIFQIWDINNVLRAIDNKSEGIIMWRDMVDKAVYNCDDIMFAKLIDFK